MKSDSHVMAGSVISTAVFQVTLIWLPQEWLSLEKTYLQSSLENG